MEPTATAATPDRLATAGVRRLRPDTTRIFEGAFSLLHCAIAPHDQFRGVFAVLLFPIRHPDRYISLRYTGARDKVREIGMIEDLQEFPEPAQHLVRASLRKQYHEQIIAQVHEVNCRYGLLFFEVTTQHGRQEFIMPWRYDRAEDYGENGKVLLDALDNRYVIPDVNALPAKDRHRFTSYIYW